MRAARPILAVMASVLVSGCALLGASSTPDTTYDLTAPVVVAAGLGSSGARLLVPEPDAIGVLEGDKIVVRTEPDVLTLLAGSQWQANLPTLVQARMVGVLQESGRIRAVGRPGDNQLTSHRLLIEIRSFEVDAATNSAVVDFFCRLMNDRDGSILASASFKTVTPVADSDAAGFVAALNAGFDVVALDILRWILSKT